MTSPGVICADAAGARARRLQCATEIRKRETGDVIAKTLGHHLVVESAHRLAELCQQSTLRAGLSALAAGVCRVGACFIGVRIVAADRTEEDLTLHRDARRVPDLY